ncbi:MAG TPA: hypothetical protein DHW82_11500 [Spirochaetia bacterium]|nr:hypothetical protein [Spirochaetia bacterium]
MQEILKSLTGRDPFIVNSLLEKISRVFEIEKKELDRYFNRIKNKTKPYEKKIEKKAEAVKHFSAELEIVLLFIHNPKLYLKHQDKISEAFFEDTENVLPIFQAFKESFSDETFREDLLFSLLSEELGKIVGRNLNSKKYRLEPERQLLDIFAFLRLENIKIQRQGVLDQIKEAEKEDDFERVLELMKEEQGLSREIHELKNKLKTV